MVLLGFLAKKYSGKDTVVDYLVEKHSFQKMSFATPLKDVISILFGFDNEQLYGNKKEVMDDRWGVTPRTVMQYLGTEVFRHDINKIMPNIGDDFWVKSWSVQYQNMIQDGENNHNKDHKHIGIADCRFQNEVDAIKQNGGIIIKIIRPGLEHENDSHASENIDAVKNFDHVIVNDGTLEDLYKKVDQFMSNLLS